ncbi:MAG: diguanylate cyclase [Actinomycetota bacterium]|nr:diguanylate cyclase [Actinomycetota bacterium]
MSSPSWTVPSPSPTPVQRRSLGGDKFVVLAEKIGEARVTHDTAERARTAIRSLVEIDGDAVSVACSIGAAVSDGHHAGALLHEADTAMYWAKARGGDRWEQYDSSMGSLARRRPR